MRERKKADDAVAQRLRSVLAGPVAPAPTSPAPWAGVRPAGTRQGVTPLGASPAPPPVPAAALAELATAGPPLSWDDIVPGWPDDVELEPPGPDRGRPPASDLGHPPGSARATPPGSDPGYPSGSAWATPPGSAGAAGSDAVAGVPAGGLSILNLSDHLAEQEQAWADARWPSPSSASSRADAGGPSSSPSATASDAAAGSSPRPHLPPPAWVLPEPDEERPESDAGDDVDGPPVEPEPSSLSSAGAFGGPIGEGRRFGLRAFDPGRRGVKALTAVAVVVIVLAAVLAWRSRPRVDPVAPPVFGDTASPATAESPAAVTRGGGASAAEVVIAVGGKVRKPGLVRLAPGARVADALTAAGGAAPGVDVAMLNLARKVVDGELIMVGVTPPPGVAVPPGPAVPGGAPAPAGALVNLNTATIADLDALPGVGPVLAQRILDARDAQGGFRAVGDLRKVDGIGDARYEQLKDLVTV